MLNKMKIISLLIIWSFICKLPTSESVELKEFSHADSALGSATVSYVLRIERMKTAVTKVNGVALDSSVSQYALTYVNNCVFEGYVNISGIKEKFWEESFSARAGAGVPRPTWVVSDILDSLYVPDRSMIIVCMAREAKLLILFFTKKEKSWGLVRPAEEISTTHEGISQVKMHIRGNQVLIDRSPKSPGQVEIIQIDLP